jgi:hypothetical protein
MKKQTHSKECNYENFINKDNKMIFGTDILDVILKCILNIWSVRHIM